MGDWRFHTPGWVDEDLPQEVHDAWHQHHAGLAREFLDDMHGLLPIGTDRSLIPYVDPLTSNVPPVDQSTPVSWEGFPESVTTVHGPRALTEVEHQGYEDLFREPGEVAIVDVNQQRRVDLDYRVRDRQDEYLEWHAHEVDGVLRSVTFVCEGYDYYSFLFDQPLGRGRVVEHFRNWTGDPSITEQDLMAPADLVAVTSDGRQRQVAFEGRFNPRNRFNREAGIVHLSHSANSLAAEVRLAVTSAVPRHDAHEDPVDASDAKRLMCCTRGGEPSRSSDPNIAAGAYAHVTDPERPQRFTLTDPIGLYIRTFEYGSLQDPDGQSAPREFWEVQRGKDATNPSKPWDSRILRLHVEPKGVDYHLGEMRVEGRPLEHPGQLARLISMHLLVDLWDAPRGVQVPAIPCRGGCCRDRNGLLEIYEHAPDCGPDGVDAFPGLILPTSAPAADLRAEPTRIPLSRRRM